MDATPTPVTPSPTPTNPEPPPAAVVVTRSPREIELETELETERARSLEAERKAAEFEDQFKQLKEIDSRRPAPQPAKKKVKVPGATFFHEDEEIEIEEEN